MSSGVVPCSSLGAGSGMDRRAEAPPGGSQLGGDHLQEWQHVEPADAATPGDQDRNEIIAALDGDRDERARADLVAQRDALTGREVGDQAHERRGEVKAGRRRASRGGCVDARDGIGAEMEAGELPAEDGLDPREQLGLDLVPEEPDMVTLELREVASEPEVAEAPAGDVEQLVSRFGARDAAAQLREGAQRATRRVGVRLLGLHPVEDRLHRHRTR